MIEPMQQTPSHGWVMGAKAHGNMRCEPGSTDWGDFARTRGRSVDMEEIFSINEKLALVLLERGQFLFDLGKQKSEQKHYKEAKADLLQAYDLDPETLLCSAC